MLGNMNSMPERPLTFFDVTKLTFTLFSLAWRISAGSAMGWWRNGGTVSTTAMGQKTGNGAIVNVSKLNLTFSNATVTIEIRPAA